MLSDCLVLFPAHCDPGNVGWRNAAMGGEHWQEVFSFSGESNKVRSFGNRGIGSVGVRERQQAESLSRRKQQETPKRVGSRYPAKPQWLRRKREFLGGLCEFVTDWEGSESCWRESKIDPHQDYTVLRGRIFSFFKLFLKSVSPTKAEFSSFKNEKPLTTYPPHISNLTLATTLSILMIPFKDWWFCLYLNAWRTWEPVTSLGKDSVQRAPAYLNYVHPLYKFILMDSVCFPD